MLKWYVIGGATFRWHMRGIRDGHCEDSFEAGMAHPMPTCKSSRTGDGNIVRETSQTSYSANR